MSTDETLAFYSRERRHILTRALRRLADGDSRHEVVAQAMDDAVRERDLEFAARLGLQEACEPTPAAVGAYFDDCRPCPRRPLPTEEQP